MDQSFEQQLQAYSRAQHAFHETVRDTVGVLDTRHWARGDKEFGEISEAIDRAVETAFMVMEKADASKMKLSVAVEHIKEVRRTIAGLCIHMLRNKQPNLDEFDEFGLDVSGKIGICNVRHGGVC